VQVLVPVPSKKLINRATRFRKFITKPAVNENPRGRCGEVAASA